MSKKQSAWRVGEVGIPVTEPFGEALVDWARFSKWLKKYR